MASDLLHADDTPIRVLDRSRRDRGLGKGVKKGRIWAYVRDQRPWAGTAPPGAAYRFAPDWKESTSARTWPRPAASSRRTAIRAIQASTTRAPTATARFREAACWAHLRRDFHDVWTGTRSEIAREALDRIGALYDIEREITGSPPKMRLPRGKPQRAQGRGLPGLGGTPADAPPARATWPRPSATRSAAGPPSASSSRTAAWRSTTTRPSAPCARLVIGRKNWLFAGADTGGETLARAMTLIETAKINGLDPQAYLADLLDRIHDHKINRLDELLPWNWVPVAPSCAEAA